MSHETSRPQPPDQEDAGAPPAPRPDTRRSVEIDRLETGVYLARNERGGELRLGSDDGDSFTPVELLLVAIAGCTAVDVDTVTARRAEPTRFTVRAEADKVREADGSILRDIAVTFTLRFDDGPQGDAARAILPRAVQVSHDRTCTVSRTVEGGVGVEVRLA